MFQGKEYVYEVYKEKSFSKAAEKLFISQPSLSATVKRVEEKVGSAIFDRSVKPIALTEIGKEYIHAVEAMLSIENSFYNKVNDLGNLKTGKLVLGGSNLFSSLVFPSLMSKFAQLYPQVELVLREERTAVLAKLLQDGEIDLMLDYDFTDEYFFDKRIFRSEHLVLAVPKNFAINEKFKKLQISQEDIRSFKYLDSTIPVVPLDEFSEEPFVLLKTGNNSKKRAIKICNSYGFIPKSVLELDQQMTAYHVTGTGLGITFLGDTLVRMVPANPNVVYYKLPLDLGERTLFFSWKRGRHLSRAMEEFLKMACEN